MPARLEMKPVTEYCRECRDEDVKTPAEFIVWGKLMPPESLGPRCATHVAKHIGWHFLNELHQWAIFDLRGLWRT